MSKSPSAQIPVARLPNQVGAEPLSAAVQPPATGWLSVKLCFLGEPVQGIAVAFHESGDDGKPAGKISKEGLVTDGKGVAAHDAAVTVGHYFCEITYAKKAGTPPKVEITTVDAKDHPLVIDLPAGRPTRDLG